MRFIFCGLVVMTACTEKQVVDSTALATPAARVQAFCELTLCPTRPEDVLFQGVEDQLRAVAKVSATDVAQWGRGCVPSRSDVRPAWFGELTKGAATPGWLPTTAPDTVRCGDQARVIHVKERLVIITATRR
jgi:hypothetical protein